MYDVTVWAALAGIIGGCIYVDITAPTDIPHIWCGMLAGRDGGFGIWDAILSAAVVGIWRVRKHGGDVALFMDAVAPALVVAQASAGSGTTSTRKCSAGRRTALEPRDAARVPSAQWACF